MEQKWFIEVEAELTQMKKNIARDFRMRAGNIFDFAPIDIDSLDLHIRPAVVFLMAKLFSGDKVKIQPLASVIQFIHLATVVHYGITDKEDKFKPQYPALIGDYLYSKFFAYLSLHDALEFLAPLSEVITEIHIGGILRKEKLETGDSRPDDCIDVLKKESGLLMSQACLIPAMKAGVSKDIQQHAQSFGLNLGIAWGIAKEQDNSLAADEYIAKAQEELPFFPAGSARDALQNLLIAVEQSSRLRVTAEAR